MRFKSYNVAGREFRREMELTWFGIPIFGATMPTLRGRADRKVHAEMPDASTS